jgi:hypothetical protein
LYTARPGEFAAGPARLLSPFGPPFLYNVITQNIGI